MIFQKKHATIELSERIIRALDAGLKNNAETAVFAMGCFMRPDALFGGLEGIFRTRTGYLGGQTPKPTYEHIGDHIEGVEVLYDPQELTYERLLDFFWYNHDPRWKAPMRRYSSAIFPKNESQAQKAQKSLESIRSRVNHRTKTMIISDSSFHMAELQYQKRNLRRNRAMMEVFTDVYRDPEMIRDSTAAARYNCMAWKHKKNNI